MKEMMDLLKSFYKNRMAPASNGVEKTNKTLREELPFKVHKFKTGSEYNGWIIPKKWEAKKAIIKKNGKIIYDGMKSPLGVVGYSKSFKGRIKLKELKKHLFYTKKFPNELVYHCDYFYKPWKVDWGFSIPYNLFRKLKEGEYEVELITDYKRGEMQVLDFFIPGKSKETILLNAHNCHAGQADDGPSGIVVGIELMKYLMKRENYYSYRLIIAPEHLGTIFYLKNCKKWKDFKYCIFLEMLGNKSKFALQESFNGDTELDRAFYHVLKHKYKNFRADKFRKIVGNDETVWESAGYEIPTVSISRSGYTQYHTTLDNEEIISPKKLKESFELLTYVINVLENNYRMKRQFKGLIALSNPKYNLYIDQADPSIRPKIPKEQENWNYLMDCMPRYFDMNKTILDISEKHGIFHLDLLKYLMGFEKKGLIRFYMSNKLLEGVYNSGKILGKRVYLRELQEENATKEYCGWLNSKEVNKYLETRRSTIPKLKKYIRKQIEDQHSFFVGIFDKENDKHIGNIKIEPIDFVKKVGTYGILIGDTNYWKKGIGTEATKLIIDYCFRVLKLDKIDLGVITNNKKAIRCYEKSGFKVDKIKKKAVRHGKVVFDEVLMSIHRK